MSVRQTQSPHRALLQAKTVLAKFPSQDNLAVARANIPASFYPQLAEWMCSQSHIRRVIIESPNPKDVESWKVHVEMRPNASSLGELSWAAALLIQFPGQILQFSKLHREFTGAYLSENQSAAHATLDAVEKTLGQSFWLVKRRLATLQHFDGLEPQKRYAQSVRDADRSGGLIRYLTHYASYRVEEAVSPQAFRTRYAAGLGAQILPDGVRAYLRMHVLGDFPQSHAGLADILQIENRGAIVDLYEAFVVCCQAAASQPEPELAKLARTTAALVGSKSDDPRLHRIVAHRGGTISPRITAGPAELAVYEAFLKGDYSTGYSEGLKLALQLHDSPQTMLLTALCASDEDVRQCPYPTIGYLRSASGYDASTESISQLARSAWALQGTPYSNLVTSILKIESTPYTVPAESPTIVRSLGGLGTLHPAQARWIAGSSKIRGAHSEIPDLIPTAGNVSESESTWRAAVARTEGDDLSGALELFKRLLNSPHWHYRRLAKRFISSLLIRLGRFTEAVESMTTFFIADHGTISILPVEDLFDGLDKATKKALSGSLQFVIASDMYALKKGTQANHLRRFSYEDYLSHHGVTKPSKIRHLVSEQNLAQHVYFLKSICVESVMDASTIFRSSTEVAQERIDVCRLLEELDPANADAYQSEIRGIAQRLTVRKRLREIEQSKIYVDIDSVKEAARRELRESYQRYISFLKNGLSPEDKVFFQAVKEKTSAEEVRTLLTLEVPRNERAALIETIFILLRDEYVSSSQHGLDGYISVRIRHGTLAGQLRSPIEAESLLTQRDARTNEYKPNTFWLERLGVAEESERNAVNEAFANFSKSFDSLVDEISGKWLQVNKGGSDSGMIDFALQSHEIAALSTLITADTPLDEFLDQTISYFSKQRLELSLSKIRDRFEKEVKPKIRGLLLELQTSVQKAAPDAEVGILRTAVGHAMTTANITLDRVIEWFRLPAAEKDEPFSIEEAIEICRATRPDFQSTLEIPEELENFRIKANLTSFVDILYVAFENVVKHAGTSPPVASIRAQLIGNSLSVRIQNVVAEGVATEAIRKRVAAVADAVHKQPFSTSVRKEGGTGFHKIKKILHHDFRSIKSDTPPTLDFGFESDTSFFVEIQIPIRIQETLEDSDSRG
ncbi:MAG: hypothetical protein SF051_15175 [Elusimicrobiota bacterium]|nr:hypothetical protein [Elusimicrobiota bacterium]